MLQVLPRLLAAFVLALLVTFAVFWMMQGLISTGQSVLEQTEYAKLVDFVDLSQDDDLQTKERKPKKPPAPPKEPPKPEMPKPSTDANQVNVFDI
ncbi:MAG: protein TonB, partial [Pseudomonadales bacterium]|nr:protein TonB [Pseudomonadales bacterium]